MAIYLLYSAGVDCGDPGTVPHATVTGINFSYSSAVLYTCNAGYLPRDEVVLTCLSSGHWDTSPPVCMPIQCQKITAPVWSDHTGSLPRAYGSKVVFSCQAGFNLVGVASLTCQADGLWSAWVPACTAVTCPLLTTPPGSEQVSVNRTYTGHAVYRCLHGYEKVNGLVSRVCKHDGQWSGSDLLCQGKADSVFQCCGT